MIRVAVLVVSLGAAGCVVPTEGTPHVLLATSPLDGGAGCPAGGQMVSAGDDANDDRVLEASEVTSSIPVCDWPRLQSGGVTANYTTPNWTLAQGTGDRAFSTRVVFPSEFATPPSVVVSLRFVDSSAPQRVEVNASAIDTKGFLFTARTWDVSLVNGVGASWLAYTD